MITFKDLPNTETPLTAENLNSNFSELDNKIINLDNKIIDYEEGSFTPTIKGQTNAGTPTYILQAGQYRKIGKTIIYNFRLGLSSFTGATGMLLIDGLPTNYDYYEAGVGSVVFTRRQEYFNGFGCVTRLYGKSLIIDNGNLSAANNANWDSNTYIYGTGVLLIQ